MGDSEAARILGQADLADGYYDNAYALLQPYVESRLAALRKADTRYDSLYDKLWDEELAKLNQDIGPKSFFDDWNSASKDAQGEIVDSFIRKQLRAHADLTVVRQRWRDLSKVVPIALDVGTLMLFRAQGIAEPTVRKQQLEKAEATFLAVQGVAGKSERFRKDLGQVYYWLGKHKEGEEQFDALLNDSKRASLVLLDVVDIYRELGLADAALVLAKEAYENASDDNERQYAARKCSLLAETLDEEITWLERSDPANTSVQASLNEAQARKARRDKQYDKAATYLRKAIDIYSAQEVDATSSNNLALAAFALQRLEPEAKLLALAREKMIEAVNLSPSNAIILGNGADNLLEFALAQYLEKSIGLEKIDWNPGYRLFNSLWNSTAQRQQVIAEFSKQTGIREAMAYLSKALVLRSKDSDLYDLARQFYSLRREPDELTRYLQLRLAANQDRSEYAASAADYYRGDSDDSAIGRAERGYQYWLKLLATPGEQYTGVQRAIQLSQYVSACLRALRFGVDVDTEALVEAVRAGDAKSPNAMSRQSLVRALLLSVYKDLRKQPGVAAAAKDCARCFAGHTIISLLAAQVSATGDLVRQHPASQAAARRNANDLSSYAGSHTAMHWGLLSRLQPAAAKPIAAELGAGSVAELAVDILLTQFPSHPQLLYQRALMAQLQGDAATSNAMLAVFSTHKLRASIALP